MLLAVFALGVTATVGAARLGAALLADARARTAADAAALAGAGALARGEALDPACRAAARLATANGAEVTACSGTTATVTVTVVVAVPVLGRVARAEAAARVDGPVIPAP